SLARVSAGARARYHEGGGDPHPGRRRGTRGERSARSGLDDDRLEVLAGHDDRAVVGAIARADQVDEVRFERLGATVTDRLERLERRAVPAPELIDPE